ncbi:hypothetical protein [uncultured Campylobacter sp.]|uniref:hypothetical protein n=1 Tax=uncultured Campylobacter sp. TaxID=218934 RepID=UPI00262081FD|nr:hypothetical protein [uncultured Campylobacter sp.]
MHEGIVAGGIRRTRAREAAQGRLVFKFDAELRCCRKDASTPGFRKRCCRGVRWVFIG